MIEAENLTKIFKSFRKRFTAVDSISFRVEEGEVFGFLGPNGAGKTTTIRMISGLSKPTGGKIYVGEYDMANESIKAKKILGLIPENPGFYDEMKGTDLLYFYASFYDIPKNERKRRVKKLLETVGLNNFMDKKIKTYSYGMKKRFALASALINNPKILILDEPSTGLDPKGIHLFRETIKALNARGTTIFLSSHILSEVEQVCDRVCILNKGKIAGLDSVENLSKKIGMKTRMNVYIEAEGIDDNILENIKKLSGVLGIEKTETGVNVACRKDVSYLINETLMKDNVKVKLIRKTEPSLEEIFLKITGEQNES